MQHQGGKSMIGRYLEPVILAASGARTCYLEPFVGGGNMFALMARHFGSVAAGDIQPDIALLWQAVADGWSPPDALSRDEWQALKHAEPSALRAFAGYGCSFGGVWFGSYDGLNRPDSAHYYGRSGRWIDRHRKAFIGADIHCMDYRDWRFMPEDTVVYCDPPYSGATGADAFDTVAFWAWAQEWSRHGALVFVSEYAAPDGWESVWSRPKRVTLSAQSNVKPSTEHLFVYSGKGIR